MLLSRLSHFGLVGNKIKKSCQWGCGKKKRYRMTESKQSAKLSIKNHHRPSWFWHSSKKKKITVIGWATDFVPRGVNAKPEQGLDPPGLADSHTVDVFSETNTTFKNTSSTLCRPDTQEFTLWEWPHWNLDKMITIPNKYRTNISSLS